MSIRVRKSVVSVTAASLLAAGAVTVAPLSGQATAAPPGLTTVSQFDDVTYDALFALGIQIYERVTIRPIPDMSSPLNELVLRRVWNARDGKPGSKRYGFIGQQLPAAFAISEGGNWVGGNFIRTPGQLGEGLLVPLNPTTLNPLPNLGQALYASQGQIGPLRGAALVGSYYG